MAGLGVALHAVSDSLAELLERGVAGALSDDRFELVQARNVLPGCYSFTASRM